jgi:hypothetical protein
MLGEGDLSEQMDPTSDLPPNQPGKYPSYAESVRGNSGTQPESGLLGVVGKNEVSTGSFDTKETFQNN